MKLYDDKLIIVTGGAGFIGSGVLRHLNDAGMTKNLVVVDELGSDERWKNLRGKSFSEFLHKDDLFEWLVGRESDIAAFIHLGACSDTTESDADYLMDNNYRYTVTLAEYALHHGIRFIYASSAATYGDGSRGFSDQHEQLENLHPLNMYGFSKHLFDLWCQSQGVLDQVVGLKYFNVFGPNEYHKGRMASALVRMLPDVRSTGKVKLFKSDDPSAYADGEQSRDFIYVKDAVQMTCDFLENDVCGIFNIGTGKASTWNDLARNLISGAKLPAARIEYMDMPETLHGKYQNYTCADMSKYTELVGPVYTRPLKDSVEEYVQGYLTKGERW